MPVTPERWSPSALRRADNEEVSRVRTLQMSPEWSMAQPGPGLKVSRAPICPSHRSVPQLPYLPRPETPKPPPRLTAPPFRWERWTGFVESGGGASGQGVKTLNSSFSGSIWWFISKAKNSLFVLSAVGLSHLFTNLSADFMDSPFKEKLT